MQALLTLPTDALRLTLENLLCLWRPSEVLPNVLKLPDSFLDAWLRGQKVLNMMHLAFPVASLKRLIRRLPSNPDISVLHLPAKVMETAGASDTLEVLNTVDEVLDALPSLSFFGIHGLRFRKEHLHVFISMCRGLRNKLIGLSLSLKDWEFEGFHGECFLLEAIGKLRKLEMLAFQTGKSATETELISCSFLQVSKSLRFLSEANHHRNIWQLVLQ
jgi:hypothetical protein